MSGKDANNKSPYFTVFGMEYHDGLADTLDEARKCNTIEDLLAKYPNESLRMRAERFCELRNVNEANNGDAASMPDTLPHDYWDDTQPPKLPSSPPPASKDDEAASPAPKKPSSTPTPDDAAKKPPSTTTPAPTTTPSNDGGTMTSDRKKPLPFSAAPAKFKSLKKILLNPGETLVFTKLCGIKISIPDEPYLKACSTTQMWWHSDFIATFAALSAHQHHKTSEKHSHVKLIHVPYPNGIVEESEKRDLDPEIKVIASVVHDVDHFAVLEVVLGSKVVNVVDGLSVDIRRWIKHVINVFIRCKLMRS